MDQQLLAGLIWHWLDVVGNELQCSGGHSSEEESSIGCMVSLCAGRASKTPAKLEVVALYDLILLLLQRQEYLDFYMKIECVDGGSF